MQGKRKIYFRADAGPEIGYGHYIRSLALADMLMRDFNCMMFTRNPTEYQLREAENVCPVAKVPDSDKHLEIFLNCLKGDEIVVLDNYFYTTEYQQAIKAKGCKLVCIDDMHDKHYVADAVINHGCSDASLFDVEPYTHLCLGMDYALLRRAFRTPVEVERYPDTYAICFGGSDPLNLTYAYAKQLQQTQPDCRIIAVVGDSYQHLDSLRELKVNIQSRVSADAMAEIFGIVENVICSASTTAYEALACGAKVYAGWYVDNQREFYANLVSNHAIVALGDLREGKLDIDETRGTKNNYDFGSAIDRIRGLFIYLDSNRVNYTDMTGEQSYSVWKCRNLPEIRACMSQPDAFDYVSHSRFVSRLVYDETCAYFAWFRKGKCIASYDFTDIQPGVSAERGLYIHPSYQGMRIGTHIEQEMVEYAKEQYHIHTLYAAVLKTNPASYHYHLHNGYTLQEEDNEYYILEKQIG